MRTILSRVAMILGLLVTALVALPPSASAGTYDGCPADVDALNTAIAGAGSGGTVNFTCDITYTLSSEITLDSVTINGGGHNVVFDGNHATRVFNVRDGANVRLIGVSVINGQAKNGSGIYVTGVDSTLTIDDSTLNGNNAPSDEANSFGGAIYSYGTLTITRSTLQNNFASRAGALYSLGKVTVVGSTVTGNSGWYTAAMFSGDQIVIVNSTISANNSSVEAGAVAIYGPNSRIINSTFAFNSTPSLGASIRVAPGGGVTVSNTILMTTSGVNCSVAGDVGMLVNGGGNFSTDASCSGATEVGFLDLRLGPLEDNGGPTKTHELFTTSVAIGAGLTSVCNNADVQGIDQRGYVRSTTSCDAGAFDTTGVEDETGPTITPVSNPASPDGTNNWYRSDVSMTWTVVEVESPLTLVLEDCGNQTLTTDTAELVLTCTATSVGGSTSQTVTLRRDATSPAVAVTGVTDGAIYSLDTAPVAGCSTTDATSGVATNATASISGGPYGQVTVTCSGAIDNAGNTASPVSATYTIHYDWQGFASTTDDRRGPRKVLAGLPITVRFSIGGNVGLEAVESITTIACNAAPGTQPAPALLAGTRGQLQVGHGGMYSVQLLTPRSWANSCQLIQVNLADGTTHEMQVNFLR